MKLYSRGSVTSSIRSRVLGRQQESFAPRQSQRVLEILELHFAVAEEAVPVPSTSSDRELPVHARTRSSIKWNSSLEPVSEKKVVKRQIVGSNDQ